MRFLRKSFALAMISALITALPLTSNSQRKKHIAILDFEFNMAETQTLRLVYGDIKHLCRQVSDRLEVNMVNLKSYNLVERREIEKLVKEQDYGQAGRIDPDTAAKIGRMLGVDALVIGSLTQLEFTGLPEEQIGGAKYWSPEQLKAKLVLNFRVVDATTAKVDVAQDATGLSFTPGEPEQKENIKGKITGGVKKGFKFFKGGPSGPSIENFKRVIGLAVDNAVVKMAQQLEEAATNAKSLTSSPASPKTVIEGRIHSVKGLTLFVVGLDRSQVKVGDRLFIRRFHVDKDLKGSGEIRYSEKIGELEVTEIQEAVIVGTFSGAETVKVGDTVTNK